MRDVLQNGRRQERTKGEVDWAWIVVVLKTSEGFALQRFSAGPCGESSRLHQSSFALLTSIGRHEFPAN